MNVPSVYVNEMFVSPQGEGILTGYSTLFIRLQGCSVCCKWCDTKHSWKKSKGKKMLVTALYNKIMELKGYEWICITGGEPLEQSQSLLWLVNKLNRVTNKITIETSGSVILDQKLVIDLIQRDVLISLSPKLKSALGNRFCMDTMYEYTEQFVKHLDSKHRLQYKFVVGTLQDLTIVEAFYKDKPELFEGTHLFLQVENSKMRDTKFVSKCVNFVEGNSKWRLTIQQHSILGLR